MSCISSIRLPRTGATGQGGLGLAAKPNGSAALERGAAAVFEHLRGQGMDTI
jgi:hypothetical protein